MKKVVVIGGGITGLSAAQRLSRLSSGDIEIILLEHSDRLGGKILTERTGQHVIELGPDSFLTAKSEAIDLIRELGLESKLMATNPKHSEVFVYTRKRMRQIPEGLLLMAPSKILPFLRSDLFTWKGKCRMALDYFIPATARNDESMGQFALRRLGREALETLVQPVMAGIYAGDAELLSLECTFPRFLELEKKHGSIIRGLRKGARKKTAVSSESEAKRVTMFMTLSGGLGELASGLANELKNKGVNLKINASVRSVEAGQSGYRVILQAGEEINGDAVIVTAPGSQAADMIAAVDSTVAAMINEIPFVSTATVSLEYETAALKKLPKGFGFVVAQDEMRLISAATFSSSKFPGRTSKETFLIRCFLGGAGREKIFDQNDRSIIDGVILDLNRLLGIQTQPKASYLHRWMRANPQYNVGHKARIEKIQARLKMHPGLWLAGSSYFGVGIPDCIASGQLAAQKAYAYLSDH